MLKNNFPMEMRDFTWQHQKYARVEIYVVTYVCYGVRGRALASHIGVRGFKPQRDGRLPSLIC